MTNSTDMFKIIARYRDGGSILVEYNQVQYFLDHAINSPNKNTWYYQEKGDATKIVGEELQEILHYVLERHNNNNK